MINKAQARVIGVFVQLYRSVEMLKQETFAQELGISRAALSLIEDGKRSPTLDQLLRISDRCDVCLCSLLGRNCSHLRALLQKEPLSKADVLSAAKRLLALTQKQESHRPSA
jgi:DNA-binding XRE family transcriptional regulator